MDNDNSGGGGELWRLLQGDSAAPLPDAELDAAALADAPEGDALPPPAPLRTPRAASSKPAPGVRPRPRPFPEDEEFRDEEPGSQAPERSPENYIAQDSSVQTRPASTDTSQLQQILSASTPEGFEYRPAGMVEDDIDAAVRAFNRDASEVIYCRNHPAIESVGQCPICQAFFCQQCLVVRRGKLICRDCAVAEYTPTEEEVLAAAEQGLDEPGADTQITEVERPEFELGGSAFGGEGHPTNSLMQAVAWALDFGIVRGGILLFAILFSQEFKQIAHPLLHLLDAAKFPDRQHEVVQTLLLAGFGNGLWLQVLPVLAIIDFFYQFICLIFFNRTIGMSWVGMRVATEWGEYASFGASAARSAVYSFLLGLPPILVGIFMPDWRGLHDIGAGTIVINYSGLKRVDLYETVPIKR